MRDRNRARVDLRCETCGQLPEAPRVRLAIADIITVLPIEFVVNVLVIRTNLPEIVQLVLMSVPTTILVLWVTEPSIRRLLRTWLHSTSLKRHRHIHSSPGLWRVRADAEDVPGSLERVLQKLAHRNIDIVDLTIKRLDGGWARDEFLLSAPQHIALAELHTAFRDGGATNVVVQATTPLMVTDSHTRILSLAARVAADPEALPDAVAELLDAEIVDAPTTAGYLSTPTILKLPTYAHGALMLSRPGEPFTAIESARAHRIAEIAETVEIIRSRAATA